MTLLSTILAIATLTAAAAYGIGQLAPRSIRTEIEIVAPADQVWEHLTATDAYRKAFGAEPETGFWTFSTNGVAIAGMHGIPSIGFGPGHEHFAHAPNEQVEVEHLVRCTAFYKALVETLAGQQGD